MTTLRHTPTVAVVAVFALGLAALATFPLVEDLIAGDLGAAAGKLPITLVGVAPLVLVLRTRVVLRPGTLRIVNFVRRVDVPADQIAGVHLGWVAGTWTVLVERRDGTVTRLWALSTRGPAPGPDTGDGPAPLVADAERIRTHLGVPA